MHCCSAALLLYNKGRFYGHINYCNHRLYNPCSHRDRHPLLYLIKRKSKVRDVMKPQAIAYFLFGLSLVVILLVIIIFYYSKKRHKKVEEPKYKMLEDED